jgi:hypothetical protein
VEEDAFQLAPIEVQALALICWGTLRKTYLIHLTFLNLGYLMYKIAYFPLERQKEVGVKM